MSGTPVQRTFSNREINQDLGRPSYSLADALAMEGGEEIEFDPSRLDDFPESAAALLLDENELPCLR